METFGERLETIILSRRGGNFGEYLGVEGVSRRARLENQVFKVRSCVEVDAGWMWEVTHEASGLTERSNERWGLCFAADRLAHNVKRVGAWKLPDGFVVSSVPMAAFLAARQQGGVANV
ncbi:hypothetical protein [Modicisalibacter xianhensis]|uniref:Uncharacterized protein n=1 Tax=Modicisalibacter xianhensis TaxID=442341 RepID=A0A1I3ERM9_9GAMM|nr:hypothetical protein [Halomonas xianhensis]SFI01627.1 hypothetical protein SAMN04487959_114136 [Halomonas xianhensis]